MTSESHPPKGRGVSDSGTAWHAVRLLPNVSSRVGNEVLGDSPPNNDLDNREFTEDTEGSKRCTLTALALVELSVRAKRVGN